MIGSGTGWFDVPGTKEVVCVHRFAVALAPLVKKRCRANFKVVAPESLYSANKVQRRKGTQK